MGLGIEEAVATATTGIFPPVFVSNFPFLISSAAG